MPSNQTAAVSLHHSHVTAFYSSGETRAMHEVLYVNYTNV